MTAVAQVRLAALIAVSIAGSAAQARDNSWYIGLRGGVVFPADRRFIGTPPNSPDFNTTESLGWAAAARLGYDFGLIRTEVDVGYNHNKQRSVTLLNTTPVGAAGTFGDPTGKVRNWTIMANALFDIINGDTFSVSAGAGAGAARVDAHNFRLTPGGGLFLNDSDWVFAWNAVAGARVALSENVELAVDYRYLRPNRARLFDPGGQGVSTRTASHTALVGLNFNFGGGGDVMVQPAPPPAPEPAVAPPPPPPPPEPAPAPAPPAQAGPIMLFFDFDSSVITPEARQLITQAADPARQAGMGTLSVSGHADRSGSGPYNQALGLRRAQAVQRELEGMGIERGRVQIQSFGEDRSLVETVDGQREPQNRRVEIIVQPR